MHFKKRITSFLLASFIGTASTSDKDMDQPFPDTKIGPDFSQALELLELKNSENDISKVTILYNERTTGVLLKNPINFFNWEHTYKNVAEFLRQHGYNANASTEIAKSITPTAFWENDKASSPISMIPFFGLVPSAAGWNIHGHKNIIETTAKPSAFCAVQDLSTSFNGAAWFRALMDMEKDPRDITLPVEYGSEFHDFVRYHELAHCMGANEERADYVAAKLFLKNHTDKARALTFLKMFQSIRASQIVFFEEQKDSYYGCFLALNQAITQFEQKGIISETEQEIWSLAASPLTFGGKDAKDVSLKIMDGKETERPYNYKKTKDTLNTLLQAAKSKPEEKILKLLMTAVMDTEKYIGASTSSFSPSISPQ